MVESNKSWRYIDSTEALVEKMPNRTHYWHCKPGMIPDTNLLVVRVQVLPGECHGFHKHPHMEESLYVLGGTAEFWVEQDKRIMKAGDSVYIPADIVHAIFNIGPDVLDFLAILGPAQSPSPGTIELSDQEPYRSWRRTPMTATSSGQ